MTYRQDLFRAAARLTDALWVGKPGRMWLEHVPDRLHPDLPMAAWQRRSVTARVLRARDVEAGRQPSGSPHALLFARCVLIAHDALRGCWDGVPEHERLRVHVALSEAGFPVQPPLTVVGTPEARRPTGPVTLGFAFPWRPRGLGETVGVGRGEVVLDVVDAASAPVACTLWTPDGRMAVRRDEDGFLRPLCRPGSWLPVDVDEFAALAATGSAWRDNPFLPRPGRGHPVASLSDHADEDVAATARDGARIGAARDAALARAGSLVVVDGIVHRRCAAPTFGIATTTPGTDRRFGATWRVDGLSTLSDQDTLVGREEPQTDWLRNTLADHDPDWDGACAGDVPLQTWRTCVDALRAVLADQELVPYVQDPPPKGHWSQAHDEVDLVADVDPSLLAPVPDAGLAAAVAVLETTDREVARGVIPRSSDLAAALGRAMDLGPGTEGGDLAALCASVRQDCVAAVDHRTFATSVAAALAEATLAAMEREPEPEGLSDFVP